MTWTLQSPLSFPAHFGRILIEATVHETRPVLFGSYRNADDAKRIAENFRHYRYCLRKQPLVQPHLTKLENDYQFRLVQEREYVVTDRWFVLYLTATPDRIAQIGALNPHLAAIIAAHP